MRPQRPEHRSPFGTPARQDKARGGPASSRHSRLGPAGSNSPIGSDPRSRTHSSRGSLPSGFSGSHPSADDSAATVDYPADGSSRNLHEAFGSVAGGTAVGDNADGAPSVSVAMDMGPSGSSGPAPRSASKAPKTKGEAHGAPSGSGVGSGSGGLRLPISVGVGSIPLDSHTRPLMVANLISFLAKHRTSDTVAKTIAMICGLKSLALSLT